MRYERTNVICPDCDKQGKTHYLWESVHTFFCFFCGFGVAKAAVPKTRCN